MTSACFECQLPEPLDETTLHDGQILCLSCAETCTCGKEITIAPPQSSPALLVTPRGSITIDVVEEAEGWRVIDFHPELKLVPGDLLTVDSGVVTGVARLRDVFVFEVYFRQDLDSVESAQMQEDVELWNRAHEAEFTTALSACVAGPVLEELHFVDLNPLVDFSDMLRIPGQAIDLVSLARESFPKR